nr:heparinase II/III family protein [Micromonospora sp. DSM 115978]
HLPGQPVHHRRWEVDDDRVRLTDRVTGSGRHRLEVIFHWAPGLQAVTRESATTCEVTTCEVTTPHGVLRLAAHNSSSDRRSSSSSRGQWKSWQTPRAVAWQRTVPGETTMFVAHCELPTEITVDLAVLPSLDRTAPSPTSPSREQKAQ